MLKGAYSVYDRKSYHYALPFFTENEETAKRIVAVSANNESMLKRFPDDFALYNVGYFDDESGDFYYDLDEPTYIASIRDLIGGDN